jgi:hypothetical protein
VNLLVAVVHTFAPHPAVLGPRFDVVAAVGSHRSWATQGSLTSGLLTFSEWPAPRMRMMAALWVRMCGIEKTLPG